LIIPDEGSGWSTAVTSDRRDRIGCVIWDITAQSTAAARSPDARALEAWARIVAARVSSLLEPLAVVEIDPLKNQALLRSATPARHGDDLFYHEVILTGTSQASVRRFQGFHEPGRPREQALFPLTHQALAKLAADLTAEN
jgi:hypothetical protein